MATRGDEYLLGHGRAEEVRLRRQVRELESEASWLLDRLDIRPGARAIDLGCGLEGVHALLSARVGATGRVVGVEKSPYFAELARKFVAENALANVEVLEG